MPSTPIPDVTSHQQLANRLPRGVEPKVAPAKKIGVHADGEFSMRIGRWRSRQRARTSLLARIAAAVSLPQRPRPPLAAMLYVLPSPRLRPPAAEKRSLLDGTGPSFARRT